METKSGGRAHCQYSRTFAAILPLANTIKIAICRVFWKSPMLLSERSLILHAQVGLKRGAALQYDHLASTDSQPALWEYTRPCATKWYSAKSSINNYRSELSVKAAEMSSPSWNWSTIYLGIGWWVYTCETSPKALQFVMQNLAV
jgi:hypothetical protein